MQVALTIPMAKPLERAYVLACRIIGSFLGPKWLEAHVLNETAPTDFFRNDWSTDERRAVHVRRVIEFAEMLWNLARIEGFNRLLSQLNDPSGIEGTFAELEVGKLLKIHAVAFRFVIPQGALKQDYDLEILMPDGRKAFADTKCKIESTSISSKTIKTSLNKAREQLPPDFPGMVFIKVPGAWLKNPHEWVANDPGSETIANTIRAFLRSTGRIVSVKAYGTIIHLEGGHSLQFCQVREIDNEKSRFGVGWELFSEPQFSGTGPNWLDLMRIIQPLPSLTHPGLL